MKLKRAICGFLADAEGKKKKKTIKKGLRLIFRGTRFIKYFMRI